MLGQFNAISELETPEENGNASGRPTDHHGCGCLTRWSQILFHRTPLALAFPKAAEVGKGGECGFGNLRGVSRESSGGFLTVVHGGALKEVSWVGFWGN